MLHDKKDRAILLAVLVVALLLFAVIAYQLNRASKPVQTTAQKHSDSVQHTKPQTEEAAQQTIFPGHRIAALYGTPNVPELGVLGGQDVTASIGRAKGLAQNYQGFSDEKIVPAMEIITTVASSSPTENGDYSQEVALETLKPWVEAAQKAGVYVILDLQPGRTDFLTQAKQYEELLWYSNVGLALDPEWRLAPNQVQLEQIGSVSIGEVNATAAWLAGLTKQHKLPQKVFLLHQFRLSMIADRSSLDTSHKELAYVIQMDGQGGQGVKQETWRAITADAPANVYFGWKNFYDEDKPMLSPEETMRVTPKPWYISYQ